MVKGESLPLRCDITEPERRESAFSFVWVRRLLIAVRQVIPMKLLTKVVLTHLPPLYATEQETDPMVWVKFFYPTASLTWYAIEFDGKDLFYGFVDSDFPELGYFRLSEMLQTRDAWGLPIERDQFFTPCRLSELRAKLGR